VTRARAHDGCSRMRSRPHPGMTNNGVDNHGVK
jgi:hypothetical protein